MYALVLNYATAGKAWSALFRLHRLIDAREWLVLLWFMVGGGRDTSFLPPGHHR